MVIPQIIFYGKRSISWKEVEKYLTQYVGEIMRIEETNDFVYIGNDFANEYANSIYTKRLKGNKKRNEQTILDI